MRKTYMTLQVVSAVFAFAAAWFWHYSALWAAPDVNWDSIAALKPWLDDAARWNRAAAACAGLSALANGMSYFAMWLRV